jgi:hypothetical protein
MNEFKFQEIWNEKLNYTCYGDEDVLIEVIRRIFDSLETHRDYKEAKSYTITTLYENVGSKALVWTIITKFNEVDLFEYGTSPRNGWLSYSEDARFFYNMFLKHTDEELYDMIHLEER